MRCENGDYLIAGVAKIFSASGDTIHGTAMMRLDSLFEDVPLPPDQIAEKDLPDEMSLSAYPNPFNSTIEIDASWEADISVYDTKGRLVADLGKNRKWSPGDGLSSGIYLISAKADGEKNTIKTVYLK